MSDSNDPTQSSAALLAAVLRVVAPERDWYAEDEFGQCYLDGDNPDHLDPASKDDLARVVAMLTPEQRVTFDNAMSDFACEKMNENDGLIWCAITAPASIWLAALVAATGAEQ